MQCKAWSNRPVGVKAVRELLGVMVHNKVHTGVFLATGSITPEAIELAKEHQIALGTGEQFVGKLKALSEDVRRGLLEIAVEGDWTTPSCPSCGTKMVLRNVSSLEILVRDIRAGMTGEPPRLTERATKRRSK